MHVNKVHHVTTITRVAQDLGEDEDWLRGVANEMEIEDGVIWVYGVGEDGVLAFTDFGIENLVELVRVYKQYPELLRRADPPAAYAGRIRCISSGGAPRGRRSGCSSHLNQSKRHRRRRRAYSIAGRYRFCW
jgi:hypothetical protein